MRNAHPVRSGLLLLVIGGVIGYGVGLGIDMLISGAPNFTGSVASAFSLLFAVTAFFFGLYGYRGITRGLVWQVLGTIIGGVSFEQIIALHDRCYFATHDRPGSGCPPAAKKNGVPAIEPVRRCRPRTRT